jgi:hypothetical protein
MIMLKGSKKTMTLVVAVLLLMSVLASATPMGAQAEDIIAGSPAFILGTNSDTPTVVGFAGFEWLAIGRSGSVLTLLAKNCDWPDAQFNIGGVAVAYENGPLHDAMQGIHAAIAKPGEGALVRAITIDAKDSGVGTANILLQHFWPLSYAEAQGLHSDTVRIFPYGATGAARAAWWLRSPGNDLDHAAVVYGSGSGFLSGSVSTVGDFVYLDRAVRPAFNLDLSSVLFTSAAAGGKAGSASPNLSAAAPPTGPVKLTVLDNVNLSLSSSDTGLRTASAGDMVRIICSGAQTAGNKYVSCVIESSSGAVLYYGKLALAQAGSNTVAFTVPALASGHYTIKLFNEVLNGNNLTDFAGTPISISLTVAANAALRPPSALPKTGDGFPLWQLLALMGVALMGMGWLGFRMRGEKAKV